MGHKIKFYFGSLAGKYEEISGFSNRNRELSGFSYGIGNQTSKEDRAKIALIGNFKFTFSH